MRDFRNELLEDLLANSGEFIEIKYLTDKYCGTQTEFDPHDTDISQCRLSINRVLRELKEMKWIDLYPSGGMSTAHSVNQAMGKRQFINDIPVKVRMTTQGEIKYKKTRQKQQPTYQATFHAPFTGNFNQGDSEGLTQSINEETLETKELSKKQLEDFPKNVWYRRQGFIWLIIGIILSTIIAVLQLCNSK